MSDFQVEAAVSDGGASPAAEAPAAAPVTDPPVPVVAYAVLTQHRPPLRAGQVVFGAPEQIQALGDAARPATEADISVSAPSHFALEA